MMASLGTMDTDSHIPGKTETVRMLITGTGSGLGRFLLKSFSGSPFDHKRIKSELEYHRRRRYDCIVHCGFDTRNELYAKDLYPYYQSNFRLMEKLLAIKHKLFIFISSVAVYPIGRVDCREEDVIHLKDRVSIYGYAKLIAEQIAIAQATSSLVLRPVSIVGPEARQNNIMRVLKNDETSLTLKPDSRYNLVSQKQIAQFIQFAYKNNIKGIFNLGAKNTASLKEIAMAVGCRPAFGSHLYEVPNVSTRKVRRICGLFNNDTLDIAKEIARQTKTVRNE